MKVQNLHCSHDHAFEGWIGSEDDFQSQLGRGLVECPICGDTTVTKLPSAPRLNLGAQLETAAKGEPRQDMVSMPGQEMQKAWLKIDVPQCGYCQSGQIMSACALLAGKKKPTDADIDGAMSGNVCRCGTYNQIRAAIHDASATLAKGG